MRNQRGQSVVEFALVLPLLLLLLLGIAEFSRAWLTINLLSSAAREGCRAAVLNASDNHVTEVTKGVLVKAGVDTTGAIVTLAGPNDQDQQVQVTVTVPFKLSCGRILPHIAGGIASEFPLRAAATMRFQGGLPVIEPPSKKPPKKPR